MILASCLLFVAASTPVPEPWTQEAVDADAVEAYRAGLHADALARWDELLKATSLAPLERGRLLYNAGNAAAREADIRELRVTELVEQDVACSPREP